MKKISQYFLQGLLLLVPVVATLYVIYATFSWIDGLFHFAVPGLGFLLTIALILAVGFVSSNLLAGSLIHKVDRLLARMPLVAMLYTSIKDLVEAFVGDKKGFTKPVMVSFDPQNQISALGFVTRENLANLGLNDRVAVYLPQSYNFAANLIIVEPSRVFPLDADPKEVMKFIVSGGVSG